MITQQATSRRGLAWPTMIAGLLGVVLLGFAILSSPAQAAAPGERASEFVLDNGLKIVVVPDHRVPIVTHMVFYKIGSADEQAGEEGLAHYLEHLMFLGTAKHPKGELDRFVMYGGGSHNATTKQDGTTYYQRMPRDALPKLMEFEADRMENLSFDEAAALNERNVVMEEYRGNAGQPGFAFFKAVQGAMYGDHAYAKPPIGTEENIAKFDGAKAMAFYRSHYSPNRATVVIGGDVTEAQVRQLAEQTYARVTVKADAQAEGRPVPKLEVTRQRLVIPHPLASAITVSRSYLVGSNAETSQGDSAALSLFTYIAADGTLGRLYRELVMKGLASNVSGGLQLGRLSGQLSLTATALPGTPLASIEDAFDRAVAELAANGVTESEFADMKQRFLVTRVYDEDNNAQLCDNIGTVLAADGKLDDIFGWKQTIEKVTIEDVNRLARSVLQDHRSVTGILMPAQAKAEAAKLVQ